MVEETKLALINDYATGNERKWSEDIAPVIEKDMPLIEIVIKEQEKTIPEEKKEKKTARGKPKLSKGGTCGDILHPCKKIDSGFTKECNKRKVANRETILKSGSVAFSELDSCLSPDRKSRLSIPGAMTKIKMLRGKSKNTKFHRKKTHKKKKADTTHAWTCIRNIVKGAHRVLAVAKGLQDFGFPLNEDAREKEDLLRPVLQENQKAAIVEEFPWFLFHPISFFKTCWSILLIVLLLYSAFVTPLRIAFFESLSDDLLGWIIIEYSIDGLFGVDIVINFFSAYYDEEDKLITSRTKIALNYIKFWFFIDLVTCFPFQLIFTASGVSFQGADYNDIFRLLRVPRLYRLLKMFQIIKMFSGNGKDGFSSFISSTIAINSSKDKFII